MVKKLKGGGEKKRAAKKPSQKRIVHIEHSDDELLEMACRAVFEDGKASTSLIQRRLKIGYAHAASLIDRLEDLKLVAPADGAKPRAIKGVAPTLQRKKEDKPAAVVPVAPKVDKRVVYSEKIALALCKRLAHGESLRQICRDDDMPGLSTVMEWLLETSGKEDFKTMYADARALQAEVLFDETLEIADDGSNDWMEKEVGSGRTITVFDHEHAQRSKLRVETRKWYISKVLPKKYGEKLDIDHSSGGKPLKQARAAVINYIVPKMPAAPKS